MRRWDSNWKFKGLCSKLDPRDADFIFFGKKGRPLLDSPYKQYCYPCPVKDFCLAFGLEHTYGIWGGLTLKERRSLPNQIRLDLQQWYHQSEQRNQKHPKYPQAVDLEDFDILSFEMFPEAL